jgi:division protein CdvB (Snf7/Vps24/ESCRT-III family)
MFIYDLNDLVIVYDTLEYLKEVYNVTVKGIVGAKSIDEVKNTINKVIDDLIDNLEDKEKIKELNKYKIK